MKYLEPLIRINSFIEFIEKNPKKDLEYIASISPYVLYYICMGYSIEKQLEKEKNKKLKQKWRCGYFQI